MDWLDEIEARLRLVDEHGDDYERARQSVVDLRRLLAVARAAEAYRRAVARRDAAQREAEWDYADGEAQAAYGAMRAALAGSRDDGR